MNDRFFMRLNNEETHIYHTFVVHIIFAPAWYVIRIHTFWFTYLVHWLINTWSSTWNISENGTSTRRLVLIYENNLNRKRKNWDLLVIFNTYRRYLRTKPAMHGLLSNFVRNYKLCIYLYCLLYTSKSFGLLAN